MNQSNRAQALRLRIFGEMGHGGVTKVASGIGLSRQYVSSVLSGSLTHEPTLDKVEAWLDEQNHEEAHV